MPTGLSLKLAHNLLFILVANTYWCTLLSNIVLTQVKAHLRDKKWWYSRWYHVLINKSFTMLFVVTLICIWIYEHSYMAVLIVSLLKNYTYISTFISFKLWSKYWLRSSRWRKLYSIIDSSSPSSPFLGCNQRPLGSRVLHLIFISSTLQCLFFWWTWFNTAI